MNQFLSTPIEYLKGIGPAKAEVLKKELQLFTFNDLLFHFPYRHIDRSKVYKISELRPDMPYVQVKGTLKNLRTLGTKGGQRLVAEMHDKTGVIELVWFQGHKWVKDSIQANKEYLAFGKPNEFNGTLNIVHPNLDDPEDAAIKKYLHIMPMYNCTERMKARGIDSKAIMKWVNTLLMNPGFEVEECLSDAILQENNMISRKAALFSIHFPSNLALLAQAEHRLKFEEFFFIQLKLLRYKVKRHQLFNGIKLEIIGEYFNTFFERYLPFELTGAQKRVLKEIRIDVKRGIQMNRLVQGDVGSGKTVVALMSMLMTIDNGYQACMMAPTEILATQHYETISSLLKDMPVRVKLLMGSTPAREKKKVYEQLEQGELDILIGTHALIESKVVFKNLGMAIVDEQHRFGVEQRARLWQKNTYPPHVLVMTATPIPRTLAMTLYGDLDTSVIDELPAGRKPIQTILRYDSSRLAVYGFMKTEIKKGRQIYIVYPLIEESEKMDYKNLVDGYEGICKEFPEPTYQVSILHGRMKTAEKEFEMNRFIRGETNIMVATTVIEVGVNVPNASVMIVESAQKFGLSQLHQLRGRVGRGADQSYCILMSDVKQSTEAKQRLKTMVETTDGFKIAEADLKLRGPGQLEGTAQSGILDLKIGDLSKDTAILALARNVAQSILDSDPNLQQDVNKPMAKFEAIYRKTAKWGRIS
ncbi:MAG: ATP-dependent DNA helicase RecG [Bacteroidetes bacterium B1(2017)]|nr:MAG: ATP-dependent DNA helicase RecG [Bacteroidetes bacterium B1(2017)]